MSDVLLVLLAPPGIEEALHDWLLDQGLTQFIAQEVLEHGSERRFESALDAVRGSRPRTMFQVATEEATAVAFVEGARERWPAMGLRYWIMPMFDRGTIG
jgi:hypothetical protein